MATGESDHHRFIVRVTPDPEHKRLDSMEVEMTLLDYLRKSNLPVCCAIASKKTGDKLVLSGTLIISLFEFATGEPIVLTEWRFMTDKNIVVGLGRWLGQFHTLTQQFAKEHPELIARAREWTELHDGVLAEIPVSEVDQNMRTDPTRYGLIHGDVNLSNFYWHAEQGLPCMFDWDQVQKSWFVYDLSSPVWTVVMLEGAGSPIDNAPVPQANVQQYTDWLLEGYESVTGHKVDREMLQRMINIRREFYKRFCQRAIKELPAEHPMAYFCNYIVNWLSKEK
jgi:Ser/Thr protein kinase RdoA (MazF antagonist)